MNKIAILTNGPRAWASSRIRGWWLHDAAPLRIHAYGPGDPMPQIDECETVVFQKRQADIDIERALRYKAEGRTVIYDLTDPMWWWYPEQVRAMFRAADCVTVSSPGLLEAVKAAPEVKRAVYIADRMLASHHPTLAQHEEKDKTVLVWFGSSSNRIGLEGYLELLGYVAHLKPIELRIIDDAPQAQIRVSGMDHFTITHVPWTLETFHAQMTACDIAFIPQFPGPWGLMKSNNREVTAAWCGLPYVDGFDLGVMADLIDHPEKRREIAIVNRARVVETYETEQSVQELEALVRELKGETEPAVPENHREPV